MLQSQSHDSQVNQLLLFYKMIGQVFIDCRTQCLGLRYLGQLFQGGLKESAMEVSHLKTQDLRSHRRPWSPTPTSQGCSPTGVRLLLGPVGLRHCGLLKEQAGHCHFRPAAVCQVLCEQCPSHFVCGQILATVFTLLTELSRGGQVTCPGLGIRTCTQASRLTP